MTRLRREAIGLDVVQRGAELLDHLPRIFSVGNQPAVLDVGVTLADQPLLRIPGSALAFAGDALDAALLADVLGAEGLEFALRPNLDVEEVALAGRSGLGA